jgi:hypothetical protein
MADIDSLREEPDRIAAARTAPIFLSARFPAGRSVETSRRYEPFTLKMFNRSGFLRRCHNYLIYRSLGAYDLT